MGRATQGVRLIKVKAGDSIAAVAKVMHDDDDVEFDENGNEIINDDSESSASNVDNENNEETQTNNNE